MAFFPSIFGFGSGASRRQEGDQLGIPQGYSSDSASPVTYDSALQVSAAFAAIRIISESIGSLPIKVYDLNRDGTRTLNTNHKLNFLFSGKVNAWQTRQEYFETIAAQIASQGNDYSLIERDAQGNVVSLLPLMSDQMEVELKGKRVVYTYSDGKTQREYSDKDIWHNKLFGNGVIGLSPIGYARNTLGVAQATERSVSKVYQNGGKPSGILSIDKVLSDKQRNAVKKNFDELQSGVGDRLFVLEAGMKYDQASLSPQDIELLSSRRFNIEDVCRFFGVPSVLVNDMSGTTAWGSGIQQIVQGFYKFGLRPYLGRYESSIKSRLLRPEERMKIDIEFDASKLLRPDEAERTKTNKEAVQGGLLTPNEARAMEGREPLDGGDKLFLQAQMTPVDLLPMQSAEPFTEETEDEPPEE